MFIQQPHGNPDWDGEDGRQPKGCTRCGGPLGSDDECEFGVCLDCCRAEAQAAINDEFDRLHTESAGRLPDDEPASCDGECPW